MPLSYVTHLEAAIDGTHLPHNELQTLHEGRPLWVRYDLEAVGAAMTKETVAAEKAIHPDERVVIFNTGAAQKYVEAIGYEPLGRLPQSVDWSSWSS